MSLIFGYDRDDIPHGVGDDRHALVIGPPGSGKTSGVVLPSVMCHSGPVVTTSSKTDVVGFLVNRKRRANGQHWFFGPGGFSGGTLARAVWDPVVGCRDFHVAMLRADSMVRTSVAVSGGNTGDSFWLTQSARVLAALLHAADIGQQAGWGWDVTTLLSWVNVGDLSQAIEALHRVNATDPHDVLLGLMQGDERLRDNSLASVVQVVQVFGSPRLARQVRDFTSFDADAFVRSWDSLHIVIPDGQGHLMAPLVVGLLQAINEASRSSGQTTLFALDEVANIAPLPFLPAMVAAGAREGVQILAILQDLSQAERSWKQEAPGFFTLFGHKLLLPGIMHQPTLQAASTALPHHGGGHNRNPAPLWPGHRISGLQPGTALWVDGTAPELVSLPNVFAM